MENFAANSRTALAPRCLITLIAADSRGPQPSYVIDAMSVESARYARMIATLHPVTPARIMTSETTIEVTTDITYGCCPLSNGADGEAMGPT